MGDDDALGGHGLHLVEGGLVVADDGHLGAELAEVLVEVVGEAVVVIDEEDHVAAR